MRYRFKWYFCFFYLILNLFWVPSAKAVPFIFNTDSTKLSAGIWRGEIIRTDGHAIIFNFSVRKTGEKLIVNIMNGSERLLVDNIHLEGDSVFIYMPFFDSHFELRIIDQFHLEGNWIKNYGNRLVAVPFKANYNNAEPFRFIAKKSSTFNISGRWSVFFRGENDSTVAVGEFKQSGPWVIGTFLTPTGDYRYLEGVVDEDSLKLSAFDGGHAYSFESKILDSNNMEGYFYAGATYIQTWVAEKNEQAKLPDEFSLTRLKDSANATLHFKFPDLTGHLVSPGDPVYKNKVVIIQILGSWCPNCMDETRFLSSWYIQNKSKGVEIIGLAYERTPSFANAKRLLQPFITRFNVTYPILATGVAVDDSLRTEKTLPEIQEIVGFPTTIFIDKKGMVRKIDTGFNGPGTGDHYEIYKKEFNELVDNLLKE
jgi:thiol-disulfide isomerase/thioredoxin